MGISIFARDGQCVSRSAKALEANSHYLVPIFVFLLWTVAKVSCNILGATHIEYTVAGVNRQFTLTQGASGTSQIFPVKKLQVDIPSGSQSVAGVNFNVQSPLDVVRVLSLRFKGGK